MRPKMHPDIDESNRKIRSGSSRANELSEWYLATVYNGMIALVTCGPRVLGDNEDGSGEPPAAIKKELDTLWKLSELLLDGPFSSCPENMSHTIQRIHTKYLEGSTSGDEGCYVYVLDVATQLNLFAECIIPSSARFRSPGTCTLNLAQRALQTFFWHVTPDFPQVRSETKARLATDMTRMESAVDALCPARLLKHIFHQLRPLRVCVLT